MEKRNSNVKGCLLAVLIVVCTALAGGMRIYGSTPDVERSKENRPKEVVVECIGSLLFSDPDLKNDPVTKAPYENLLPDVWSAAQEITGTDILQIEGSEESRTEVYMGFCMNVFETKMQEDMIHRVEEDAIHSYQINSSIAKALELGFCGQSSIWENGRGRNTFEAQLNYLQTGEGKTAYMATCIVLSKLCDPERESNLEQQKYFQWEPAARLLDAVKVEADRSYEAIHIEPQKPSVYYEKERQRTEELLLRADDRDGIFLPLEKDIEVWKDGKCYAKGVTIKGGEKFYLTAPAERETEWISPELKGMLWNQTVLGIEFENEKKVCFCVREEGKSFKMNVPFGIRGALEVVKKGDDGAALANVTFKARHKTTGKIEELTTDIDGKAALDQLICGEWEITEVTGAYDYLRREETYKVEVPEKKIQICIENEKMRPALSVRHKAEQMRKYYPAGSEVVYEIRIMNTGNVPIQEVVLQEELSEELQSCMKVGSEEFQKIDEKETLRAGQTLISSKGRPVRILQAAGREVKFDQLEPGDDLRLYYQLLLEEDAAQVNPLNIRVRTGGKYLPDPDHGYDSKPVPADEDDQAEEHIFVMTPRIGIVVRADKTKEGKTPKERTAGWYKPGEAVRFQMVVKNSGNVPVYHIELENQFSKELKEQLEPGRGQWSYGVKPLEEQKEERVVIETLLPGESASVQYTAVLKKHAACLDPLEHIVQVTAFYNLLQKETEGQSDELKLAAVPKDGDDTDSDKFWIYTPRLQAAVHAERTTGVVMHNGKYTGKRIPGTYRAGEEINYTITVTNTGNSTAHAIQISPEIGEELSRWVKSGPFVREQTQRKSWLGRDIYITLRQGKGAEVDSLEPGDSVDVTYTITLKEQVENKEFLESQVTVIAAEVIPDEDDVDVEFIGLSESVQEKQQENCGETQEEVTQEMRQTSVYTGDCNLQNRWVGCFIAFGGVAGLLRRRKKYTRNK